MPHPSAGCQTCRNRRVKCDEAKPICRRCVASQRICIERSTTKQASFSIHSENFYASGKAKRPRGPRSSLTLSRPSVDLPSQATAYFLNYYLCGLRDAPTVSACMSECLVAWKASGKECDMVDLAVSSLALAIFSRTQQHPAAAREASGRYGRLLRVAQQQIIQLGPKTRDEESLDETLLTIILMAWYETAMHRPENAQLPGSFGSQHSWSHHIGALTMLKIWNDKLSRNTPSRIIKMARRGMIHAALLRNSTTPSWMWDGSRFGEHGLDLGFDKIVVRVVNLRYAFKSLEQRGELQTPEGDDLAVEARDLDAACRDWAAQIPSAWFYQVHSIGESSLWSADDFYSSTAYSFQRPCYAAVWLQYFAARLLIGSTSLGLEDPAYQPQLLKDLVDSLVSTIPFALGRFELDETEMDGGGRPAIRLTADDVIQPALALPAVWPLNMAAGLRGVERGQQRWFHAQLARLGRVLGDGALQSLGTEGWTHDDL